MASSPIFSGQIISVDVEEHELPNGRRGRFEIVRHNGGAAVLPILNDGRLVLIRQYRAAVGRTLVEIPAGRLEGNESPEACITRELAEEAGYRAGQLSPLGKMLSSPGFCDETIHLFVARQLTPIPPSPEEDEVIEPLLLSPTAARQLLQQGGIVDSKTQLALLLYFSTEDAP
ncbi:MAG: ADP-ribose pyrophosphatase [Desulfuromonas sp.]|nr:MAG: ADP-ribose pyrophosphatase [Desulfuromonas sp.]